VRVGASAATRIALSASPGSLPPSGGVTEILAVVSDDENRRLEGVPVNFSANAGALRDTTVITDRNGEARTRLTATRETTVTATVGAVSQTLAVRVSSAPIISLTAPSTSIGEGENVTFTVNVQVGANGDPIREAVINFGDGQVQSLGGLTGSRTVSHVYQRAGTYRVEVTVTDTGGVVERAATLITVQPRAIAVTLLASPSLTPRVNTPVQFTATATSASGNITGYAWSFGDGTSQFTTGPTTSHVFGSTGRKVVRVDVTNAAGQRGEAVIELQVQP
jgi:PKD repeat protein